MAEFNRESISAMRKSYGEKGLSENDASQNPVELFLTWLADAAGNPIIVEANAMVLSTVHGSGPISRTVLLKDITDDGLTFFTNYQSRKAGDIQSNPAVSLLFPWYAMERQVIITGSATVISEADSDLYFSTRPWSSQIGAWASAQSELLDSRESLEKRWKEFADRYPQGSTVPRPPHWGGYRVTPDTFEFWQGRYSRLHDRLQYSRINNEWELRRLFP